jgi:hypothetical protein
MTTPASGQISIGDIKSELSLVGGASYDISLAEAAGYNMANGFWDTFGFGPYQTGVGAGPVPLSYFYDLQTDASYEFRVESSITDYDLFTSALSNLSQAGGVFGPNASPNSFNNPTSGTLSPGNVNAIDIVHMDQLIVGVNCTNNSPRPPFTDLYADWNDGTGYIAFAGSPFNGPVININTGSQTNTANNAGTPVFIVRCYQ